MKTILTHAVIWINLEDIMPSVISQSSHSKIVGQSVSFKKLKVTALILSLKSTQLESMV